MEMHPRQPERMPAGGQLYRFALQQKEKEAGRSAVHHGQRPKEPCPRHLHLAAGHKHAGAARHSRLADHLLSTGSLHDERQ